jgi:acyl carrier protein
MMSATLQQDMQALTALVRQAAGDGAGPADMHEDTRFVEDIGMESINRLMLMTLVEQHFGLSLEQHMATLVGLNTVGETARFLHGLRSGAAA